VLGSFAELLGLITRHVKQLEAQIAALIDSDPLWRKLDAAFREIKGVADRTIARLLAEMPEIGTLSNKAVGKLPAWRRSPATAEPATAGEPCAAAAPASAPSCMSSPRSFADTIPILSPAGTAWLPAGPKWSSASRSPASSSFASTPKPATPGANSPPPA
jgi:hypothetical protein